MAVIASTFVRTRAPKRWSVRCVLCTIVLYEASAVALLMVSNLVGHRIGFVALALGFGCLGMAFKHAYPFLRTVRANATRLLLPSDTLKTLAATYRRWCMFDRLAFVLVTMAFLLHLYSAGPVESFGTFVFGPLVVLFTYVRLSRSVAHAKLVARTSVWA